jgi:glycosyltransferase involved in cell wall biosynthesis
MRLIFVVDAPRRRGAEVFCFQLAHWLRRRGHRVRVVYLHTGNELPLHDDDIVLGLDPRHLFERAVHPRSLRALVGVVDEFAPAIVQVNGARTVKYGAALRILRRSASWKLVYRNIGMPSFWVRGRIRTLVYRHLIMARMDGVIAVSDATLEDVRTFYGMSCPQVTIPNGIDVAALTVTKSRDEIRRLHGASPAEPVLVFVGALSPEKRPDRFLKVVVATGSAGWVIGDGPLRADLEAEARRTGARVRFLGRLDRVADLVAAADVHVCCSDTEGIPGAVLEASWLRVPTVAFAVGGLPECVWNGRTGSLVPTGDTAALSEAVRALLADPGRRSFGEAARALSTERFVMDVVGARYEAFHRGLAGVS